MSLRKNLVYNFFLSLSQVLVPLITIPYISRILDPEGFGSVNFTDSLVYYFVTLAEFGIAAYAIREISRARANEGLLKSLVSELLSLHLITSIVSFLLYLFLLFWLYHKVDDPRLVWASLIFLFTNSFACEWYFIGRSKFQFIALRTIVLRLAGLAAIFLLVKERGDYYLYYYIIIGTAVLSILINLISLRKEVSFSFKFRNLRKHLSSLFITAQISLVYAAVLFLDSVLLGALSTLAAVGIYAFAARLVKISGSLVSDSLQVFYPHSVELFDKPDKEAYLHSLDQSLSLILLVALPLSIGIFLAAPVFTEVYFGKAFLEVSDCLQILAPYPLIKSVGLLLNKQVLMPLNREGAVLKSLWAGAICFVVLSVILIPRYSYIGSCWALIISEFLVLFLNHFFAGKGRYLPKLNRSSLQIFVFSLVLIPVYFLSRLIAEEGLERLLLFALPGITVYLALLLIFKNEGLKTLTTTNRDAA